MKITQKIILYSILVIGFNSFELLSDPLPRPPYVKARNRSSLMESSALLDLVPVTGTQIITSNNNIDAGRKDA